MGYPLSASQIGTYLMCARKYAFRYIEKIEPETQSVALSFGSVVHSALDWFHEQRIAGRRPTPNAVAKIFLADWTAELEKNISFDEDEDPTALRDQGEQLVRMYVEQFRDAHVIASEVAFELPLVDPETGEIFPYTLRGYFDSVWLGDVLVEVKTAARKFDAETIKRKLQLSLYAWAYRQLHKRDPSLQVITLLKTKKPGIDVQQAPRTVADDAWAVHLAVEVARGIEARVFPPNPGWMCSGCEYANACAAWRGRAA